MKTKQFAEDGIKIVLKRLRGRKELIRDATCSHFYNINI